MNTLWTISIILSGLSLLIIVGNLWISLRWYLFKKRETLIPLVGGLLGLLGLLLLPVPEAKRYCWLPPVVDPGCGLLLIGIAIEWVKKRLRR